MKKLAVVRHGDYHSDGTLTPLGEARITRTGEMLSEQMPRSIKFICSVQPRAKNSAELLALLLEPVSIDYLDELATGKDAPVSKYAGGDMEAIHKIVMSYQDNTEGLVMVTHYKVCYLYPEYFMEHALGISYVGAPIDKGRAVVIDGEKGTCA